VASVVRTPVTNASLLCLGPACGETRGWRWGFPLRWWSVAS